MLIETPLLCNRD